MRVCNDCLKTDDQVKFPNASRNLCTGCRTIRTPKITINQDYQDSRERLFKETRNMINAGKTEQEIVDSIENQIKALDDGYDARYKPKVHGVMQEYPFKIIPRTADEARIMSPTEEITWEEMEASFTERGICGY